MVLRHNPPARAGPRQGVESRQQVLLFWISDPVPREMFSFEDTQPGATGGGRPQNPKMKWLSWRLAMPKSALERWQQQPGAAEDAPGKVIPALLHLQPFSFILNF